MTAKTSCFLCDVPAKRFAFYKSMKNLVEKTDFNIMYKELNSSKFGKTRMSSVFILKANSTESRDENVLSRANSQKLYDGINKERDLLFLKWFDAIELSLKRTGNKNNGHHQEVWEEISSELQDYKDKHKDVSLLLLVIHTTPPKSPPF